VKIESRTLRPPPAVRWIARILEEAGFESWAVGGAVRDALAGHPSNDWDLTTRATPREVQRLFRRTVPIGVDHGTVGVLSREGVLYEVTTFRRDVETTGRHAVVAFAETLDEDLARRDFTINAVAWHPLREVVHDPFDGRGDLERGILRTVGTPAERFAEDYLRVLRALRFAGHFGLEIEGESWRALVDAVQQMGRLSPERIREELEKILQGSAPPSRALALYAASGVLRFLYPELDRTVDRGVAFPFSRALATVDLLPRTRPELRMAALLLGVGTDRESTHLRSAAVVERLRSSRARVTEVAESAGWALVLPPLGASELELRRWLAGVGRGGARRALRVALARARAEALRASPTGAELRPFLGHLARIRGILHSGLPLGIEELPLGGRDLVSMGFRPGPHFGQLLRYLLERVLEDPSWNDRDRLLAEGDRWLTERLGGVS